MHNMDIEYLLAAALHPCALRRQVTHLSTRGANPTEGMAFEGLALPLVALPGARATTAYFAALFRPTGGGAVAETMDWLDIGAGVPHDGPAATDPSKSLLSPGE